MKRLSLNSATVLFTSIIAILAAAFMCTLYLHNKQQAKEQQEFDTIWADMVDEDITDAGVSYADSIAFEYASSMATVVDMPEELPCEGDTMCAYVSGDTIYVEYYHGHLEQKGKFVYLHNQ